MTQVQTPTNVRSRIYKHYFVELCEKLGISHREYAVMRDDDVQEGLNLPYPEISRERIEHAIGQLLYMRTARGVAGGVTTNFYRKADLGLRVDYLLKSTVVGLI